MKRNKGFTLVELLVVIMILGILMAIIIPAVTGALSGGQNVKCNKNLKGLFEAAYVYATRYGGPGKSLPGDGSGVLVGKKFWQKLATKGTNVLGGTDDDFANPIFQCPVRETQGSVAFRGPDTWSNLKQNDPVGCDDSPHKDTDTESGSVVMKDTSVTTLSGTAWTTAYGKCKD